MFKDVLKRNPLDSNVEKFEVKLKPHGLCGKIVT